MVLKDKKLIFLLPSKTGSTSLVKMFKDYNLSFDLPPQKKHPLLSELLEIMGIQDFYNYKIYQICRNPIDRMVSSYYFQRQIIKDKDKYKNFFSLDFNQFVKLVTDNQHHLPYHTNKFCMNVFNDVNFSKRKAPTAYGVKFYLPQTKWNDIGAKVNYLKLEDLVKDCSIISKILNVNTDFVLPHKNKTKNKPTISSISLYNTESLELLKKTYQEDFKYLQYESTT